MGRKWTLLEFDTEERLKKCLEDRSKRVLFYPATGQMQVGMLIDIEIFIESINVSFPMKAMVVGRRSRPKGTGSPLGVFLEVIEADAARFQRICELADGTWKPGLRRSEPRLPAELRVSYFVPPRMIHGETLNISAHGLFIRTDGPLPAVGQGVYVRLYPSRLWFPIGLSARVSWIDEVDSRRGMGVHCFDTARSLKRLAALVARSKRLMKA